MVVGVMSEACGSKTLGSARGTTFRTFCADAGEPEPNASVAATAMLAKSLNPIRVMANSPPVARLRLVDVPEDEDAGLEHAGNVLAPQEGLLELAQRHIGDHFPEALV